MAGFWRNIFNRVTNADQTRFGRPAKRYDPNAQRLPNVIRQEENRKERERRKESGEPNTRFKPGGQIPGNSKYSRRGDPDVGPDNTPLPSGQDGEQENVWGQQGANDQEINTLDELHNRFNTWPSYENWLAYAAAQEELGMRPDWAEFREKYEGSLA